MTDRNASDSTSRDFIRTIVAADVDAGTYDRGVITRFPPEPNGFLHIGHVSAICLDFDVAAEFGGRTHLRFDDTNPETEDMRFVEAMKADVRWLGFDWGEHLYHASDYFEQLYAYAEELVTTGQAYVDSSSLEEIREYRGSVTEPGRPSPYRDRSVEENLDLFRRMRAGEFEDGAHVLRGKIDMAHPNMVMRDPVLYRIRHAHHYRSGNEWCIYPLYDFTHCLSDSIEGVTHSFCTLEFVPNREIYDWLLDNLDVPRPQPRQYEFARLNVEHMVVSKRKLIPIVEGGHVSGWDDPRMPTIAGLRRRGYTSAALKSFARGAGITRVDKRVDLGKLEYEIRADLNPKAPRVMAVLDPLKLVVTNYPEARVERLEAPFFPHDVGKEGSRTVPFTRELFIEREDFAVDPPKGFHRLSPGNEVRLRYGYVVRCTDVVHDESGGVHEVHCTYDPETRGGDTPDGRKVRGTIHWVSASESGSARVRLYDRLFSKPNPEDLEEGEDILEQLNPESLVDVSEARVEPGLLEAEPASHFQFERLGYFFVDPVDSEVGRPVFNRVVTLRDSWAKQQSDTPTRTPEPKTGRPSATPSTPRVYRPEEPMAGARFDDYVGLGLGEQEASVLVQDAPLAALFAATHAAFPDAGTVAKWVVNQVPRVAEGRAVEALPFGGDELAQLLFLIDAGEISGRTGREVLEVLAAEGGSPRAIVEARGLGLIADSGELATLVDGLIAENPDKVAAYRGGKTGLMGFFVGQAMRVSGGKADPKVLQKLLADRLD